jgi:hypothetical protein
MSGNGKLIIVGLVGLGTITTLILPKRQTIGVVNAFRDLGAKWLGTAMGTAKPA